MSLTLDLPNPDRGYAGWEGADLIDSFEPGSVTDSFTRGDRLLSCEIDSLAAFRTSPISSTWLATFQSRLDAIRAAGLKCALNLRYDTTSAGNDATADQIVAHLAQLKPILHANADVIPYAKAGFIGAWGEWHSSQNGNSCGYMTTTPCSVANPNRLRIRDALMDAFHPLTFVHFCFPDDLALWFPTALTAGQAFSGSTQARAAFHNDCQLSNGDTGTWNQSQSSVNSQGLQTMMATITDFVPYGGEISGSCAAPLRTDCASARADFSRYHLAWIKDSIFAADGAAYSSGWTAGACVAEIRNLLGYRLQLDSVTHQGTARPGQTVTANVALRNVGWARVFSPRRLVVTACLTTAPFTCVVAQSAADLRSLPSQATASTTLAVPLSLPVAGTYAVQLSAPDVWPSTSTVPAFSVRFANADDGASGQAWNALGFLTTGTTIVVN
jgi:hypothetical protein